MLNSEKVIKGLEWILQDDRFGFGVNWDATDCEPKTEEEQAGYNIQRAIALLKEQDAVKPTWSRGRPFCGACGSRIRGGKFCSKCGKPILWECKRWNGSDWV